MSSSPASMPGRQWHSATASPTSPTAASPTALRLTKHPAYVSKNLFWWFATMPMLATTGSMVDSIRNTAVLAFVSGVYYWRARTEERHLSADPVYRDYAAWMERNGPITRLINRLFSGLSGRPRPAAAPAPAPAE